MLRDPRCVWACGTRKMMNGGYPRTLSYGGLDAVLTLTGGRS